MKFNYETELHVYNMMMSNRLTSYTIIMICILLKFVVCPLFTFFFKKKKKKEKEYV